MACLASRRGTPTASVAEDAGFDEALLRQSPAVRRVGDLERGELGAQLRTVAGRGQRPDLLGERVRPRLQARRLTADQVAHVGRLPAVERDEVLELAKHAQRGTGSLAGTD